MRKPECDYNSWLDGALDEKTRIRFEASLPAEERCEAKRWQAIRQALRDNVAIPPLRHPDFVNAQVLEKIEKMRSSTTTLPSVRPFLAWGLACVIAAAIIASVFLPRELRFRSEEEFISQVISARTDRPTLSVSSFPAPDQRGVVIWIQGANYIPPTESIR